MLLGEPGGAELGSLACGQVWTCPVCAYAVRTVRGQEAAVLADAHLRSGGRAWAVTCELGEGPQALAARWQLLSAAWRRVVSGSGWAAESRRSNRAGLAWSPAVTWQDGTGWRPVLRVLLLDRPGREELHQEVVARWAAQWSTGAGSSTAQVYWRALADSSGVAEHVAAPCDGSAGRRGSAGALGPADILARARCEDRSSWWELWQEYARAATPAHRGHRAPVTFTRGLRSAVPSLGHRTDAELAAESARAGLPPLSGRAWQALARDGALQLRVLDAALRGPAHLAWSLADHGLPTVDQVRLAAA